MVNHSTICAIWAFLAAAVIAWLGFSAGGAAAQEVIDPPARVSSYDRDRAPSRQGGADRRANYINLGAKYVLWKDMRLADGMLDNMAAMLRIEHNHAVYYSVGLGRMWQASLFRFRGDVEVYYGNHNITLRRSNRAGLFELVNGDIDNYGVNLSLFYDFPIFARFSPYLGVSAMALGMHVKLNRRLADSSPLLTELLGEDGRRELKILYGYGFGGGARLAIASWWGVDFGYRFQRWHDCIESKGCALFKQGSVHEARADLVIRF